MPGVTVQVGEKEWRKLPDGLLRTELTEAAPGKPAPHGERQRDDLTGQQGRRADQTPDDRPGVGARNQPGQKRTGQRQIGGVVIEKQAGDDADAQRDPKAGREHQSLAPGPLLCQ